MTGNNNESVRIEADYQEDHGDIKMLCRDVQEIRKDMYGNGTPGMKYQFIELKNALKYNNIMTSVMSGAFIGNLIVVIFFR
jgi:hypothetical protein